jgi:hypothetical protein
MITIETFVHILDLGGTSFSRSAGPLPRSIAGSTFLASSSCPSSPAISAGLPATS